MCDWLGVAMRMLVDPNAPSYKPTDYRMLGIGLSIGAVVLFLYAAFSHRWLENVQFSEGRIGFSLIGFEACAGDRCETSSNFVLIDALKQTASRREQPSSLFAPAGVVTMALSLLAVLALGASAVFAFKQRRLAWPVLPTSIALMGTMAALLAGCLFVAKKPGGYGAVGVGPSFWAFAIACVIGIVGAQFLTKYLKPDLAQL